jgi:hypothetical protein
VLFRSVGATDSAGADGGGADAPEAASPTVAEGCRQVARALCGRLSACSPTALALYYGDETTCDARAALGCRTDQGVAGNTRTADDLVACARAVTPTSCAELLAGGTPDACDVKPGTTVNGAACGSDWQCRSTYCRKVDTACGVCAPRETAGGDCIVDGGCHRGLVCANKKCVAPGGPNADCNPPHQPCRGDLYCASATSKCLAKVAAGGACADDPDACDLTKGAICVNKICEMISIKGAGETCGLPSKTLCVGFSGLGADQDPCSGTLFGGVCAKTADDGTTCGADHKVCLAPARCVMGVCRLPSLPDCK